ncbi:MAG: HEAT repeat domain-containing protein, partial [Nitrospirae bacterium]|nr:HEAT repeat domain-containing protein [Nitrospirota bacterium]
MNLLTSVSLITLLLFPGCTASKGEDTKKVINAILKSSLIHENFFVRSAGVKAIGEMGDPKYIPMIIPSFKDSMAFVRLFTVESIAQLRGPDRLKLLLAAGGDPDPMVRIAVVKALDELAKADGKVDALPLEKILDPFTKDSDSTVLLFAKAALAKRGNETMFMAIQIAIEKEETLSPAVVALGRTKLPRAVPILAKALLHADSTVIMFSAEALGE